MKGFGSIYIKFLEVEVYSMSDIHYTRSFMGKFHILRHGVFNIYPRDPCTQILLTLDPKVCKYYLHWAIWIPRDRSGWKAKASSRYWIILALLSVSTF